MPTRKFDLRDPALAAMGADASAACSARMARVAGTHALLLDGAPMPIPTVAGVARWTRLLPSPDETGWTGPLRADTDALPFGDESFCVVLVRFVAPAEGALETLAAELARTLAPHGALLVADLHPGSLWRAGSLPGRWERALRRAGLDVAPPARCGSPWPSTRGAAGMPQWLVHAFGGAWVIEAHRRASAAIPLRKAAPSRRAVEQAGTLVPGARRQCA